MAWLSLPLTVLWVIAITNSFNLIDGIDGLAAGSALFSTLAVFIVSLTSGNSYVSMLSLGLAGAILGFLRFNFNPATIFLGDSGSLFIGFMLSALALVGMQKSSTVVAIAIPVVSFGLPILETLISVFRRYLSGQPVFAADREHIHHKLLERGLTQRQSVIILYAVSAVCGLLSLLLMNPSGPAVGIVLFVVGAGIWVGVQHLGYHEFVEIRRVAKRTMDQKKIIINNLAIRRGSERLARAKSFAAICEILTETFRTNEFDRVQLRLSPWGREAIRRTGESYDTQSLYVWERTASNLTQEPRGVPSWSLALDLLDYDGQMVGVFTAFRSCARNPLLVDVNLLTFEFRTALGDAIDRLLKTAVDESLDERVLVASS
jgi:UDP-GlcNAc:undecaprenyl-phosphate GlcNAc-1-phosphate transferase